MKLLAKLSVFFLFVVGLSLLANAESVSSPGCGDGFCDNLLGETASSCAFDCAPDVVVPACGDGFCDVLLGEDSLSCSSDCGVPPAPIVPVCGDGFCDGLLGETEVSCSADCAPGVVVPVCGDGFCDVLLGETLASCSLDCALPPPVCVPATPCSSLGCGSFDSCGVFCGECPVFPPANNPPVINSFAVPASAGKNTDVTLTVAATDNDGGVNHIEILNGGVVVATQPCGNIVSCTKSFIVRVPDAFSAVYTFVARVFDSLGAVATASGSGTTNAAPVAPPVSPVVPDAALAPVRVSIPSDEIFVSSVVPDTGCLAPGDETFLYVAFKNRGKAALKDVKVAAVVPELDIRAVSGPFSLRNGDSASRFLYFGVPESAKPGEYYVRVFVTSGKDSVAKYRAFEVSKSC